MAGDDFILAIGRLERALTRLEHCVPETLSRAESTEHGALPAPNDTDYIARDDYERLRIAAEDAVRRIDKMLSAETK